MTTRLNRLHRTMVVVRSKTLLVVTIMVRQQRVIACKAHEVTVVLVAAN